MLKVPQDYQDVKLVNCATCQRDLLGESMTQLVAQYGRNVLPPPARGLPLLGGRLWGRLYCLNCLVSHPMT